MLIHLRPSRLRLPAGLGRALLGRHVNGVLVAPKSGCRGVWLYTQQKKKLEHDGGGTVLSMYDMTTTNHTVPAPTRPPAIRSTRS